MMKRNILLLFFIISLSFVCKSQYRDDTLLLASCEYADFGNGSVFPYDSVVYSYDNHGNCISELYLLFDFGSRIGRISTKILYTYNSENKKTSFANYQWNAFKSSFDLSRRISYTYNSNHQIASELTENWDGTQYVNSDKTVYLYNASKQLITVNKMAWNGSSFYNQNSHVYTYDGNGNRITDEEYEYDFSVIKSLDIYNYDANNHLISDSMLMWDKTNATYIEMYVTYFGYNSLGENIYLSRKRYNQQKSAYIFEYEDSFYYNSKHQQLTLITKTWNTLTGKFVRNQRYLFTYTNAGKISVITRQTWNSIDFVTEDIHKFYYNLNVAPIKDWALVYPVPTGDILNIELTHFPGKQGSMVVDCEITDMAGRLVIHQNLIDALTTIPVHYFGKGIYTIRLRNGDQRISSKFVKL